MANADLQAAIRRLQSIASEASLIPQARRAAAISRLDTVLADVEIRNARARLHRAGETLGELVAEAKHHGIHLHGLAVQLRALSNEMEGL